MATEHSQMCYRIESRMTTIRFRPLRGLGTFFHPFHGFHPWLYAVARYTGYDQNTATR